jgi:hypothetical protein
LKLAAISVKVVNRDVPEGVVSVAEYEILPHADDPIDDVYVKVGKEAYVLRGRNTLKVGATTVD